MRGLVGRFLAHHLLPPFGETEQREPQVPQGVAVLLRPGLVEVLGQQRTGVDLQGCAGSGHVVVGQCALAEATELFGVHADGAVGGERDRLVAKHE